MTDTHPKSAAAPDAGQALHAGERDQPFITHTVYWIGVVVALLHLVMNYTTLFSTQWQATLHYVGLGSMCVLLYPPLKREALRGSRALLIADLSFGVVVLLAAVLVVMAEDAIYARGVNMTNWEMGLALVTIAGAIELTRRTTGLVIPTLIVISLSYVSLWGDKLDNIFRFAGLSLETLLFRSIYGDDALFGSIDWDSEDIKRTLAKLLDE